MKKICKNAALVFVLIAFSVFLLMPMQGWAAPAKNVILLMTDGTSSTHITLTRWYKGTPLALDDILVGGIRTYSAESIITDSAPAATAFATGHKTNSKFIGILPEKTTVPGVSAIIEADQFKPVATVLEGAKLLGKSVGLVATSQVQHASPAGFSAHTPFRDQYTQIAKQQVYENIDVVFGGGMQYMLPKTFGGIREDETNLINVLKERGFSLLTSREELLAFNGRKAWGLFAPDALQFDFDRKDLAPSEPSLAEMTSKAIETLSKNEKGFFLFVEASKVDWAAHANDPIGVISDLLAYDDAIRVALDFAKKDGQTLVMAFADHGTGGMAIGNKEFYKIYDKLPYETVLGPLKKATYTGEGMDRILGENRSEFNIRVQMMQNYAVDDLTALEIATIQTAPRQRAFATVIGPMLSKRAAIGWIYTGHTGEDLFLYAFGPNKPNGLIQNTDIAKITAGSLGFDLAETDHKLFVDAATAFAAIGATTLFDNSDKFNPVLIVKKGIHQAILPIDANLLLIGKTNHMLPGIVVQIPNSGKVFVPQKAVELLKEAGW
ncbi:MAG TPA: alkaline phosphatase [Negativicutes bacterium]|nr:alkaline phosphatase [Negativicutes bacterium]